MQIVLVAQDGKKNVMREWASQHYEILARHDLVATGGTAKVLAEVGLQARALASGPLGGDLHAAHIVATERPGACIFFRDPAVHPAHEADVSALVRLAILHDVPLAQNLATANALFGPSLVPHHRAAMAAFQ
jgi:methylglyoxal synthase